MYLGSAERKERFCAGHQLAVRRALAGGLARDSEARAPKNVAPVVRTADFQLCGIAGLQIRKPLADLPCSTNTGSRADRNSAIQQVFPVKHATAVSSRQGGKFEISGPEINARAGRGISPGLTWRVSVCEIVAEPVNAPIRILHVDGDSFFASCEIALDDRLQGRPVWVGGGRHGDGIVIAANREAKKFGVTTGMACFEAKRLCPHGVLCKPHYEDYRRLSHQMFQILEEYAPTLVPISIDEGFLDLTTLDRHVLRGRSLAEYVNEIRARILREVKIPVSAGLGNSSWLAKLATDVAKPGFLEVPPGQEKEFLKDRPVHELSGIGPRRARRLAALGARTFGDVARLPSTVLKQVFGIWGQQLWLFANGRWSEPLLLEVKDRTVISSNTTLPYDEPDYEAALTFTLSEATRLLGQLRREQLQLREMGLTVRFNDFSEVGGRFRFQHPQFQNSVVNAVLEQLFREVMEGQVKPVRQIRIAFWNLSRLDTQPTLWGRTEAERWGALDAAAHMLNTQFGKAAVMTGAQYSLLRLDAAFRTPKPKCPFVPQREMVRKLWGSDLNQQTGLTQWELRLGKVSRHHFQKGQSA